VACPERRKTAWGGGYRVCDLESAMADQPRTAGWGIAPLCTLTSNPTPIMLAKGTYWGDVESLDRGPEIVTLDPGMRFPGN